MAGPIAGVSTDRQGWQCPCCRTIWSPASAKCMACSPDVASALAQAQRQQGVGSTFSGIRQMTNGDPNTYFSTAGQKP